nr:DUF429 domain-containing protein [Rhizobium laguerreae]
MLLDVKVQGVGEALPLPSRDARGHELKAFEDAIDAVVCAWVGACVMDGRARAFGDRESGSGCPCHCRLEGAETTIDTTPGLALWLSFLTGEKMPISCTIFWLASMRSGRLSRGLRPTCYSRDIQAPSGMERWLFDRKEPVFVLVDAVIQAKEDPLWTRKSGDDRGSNS